MEGEELEKNLQDLKAVIELHEGRKTEIMIFDLLEKDKPSRQICQMPCDQFS
jgi:hypothetical protein